ncbi:cellular tumor antigen p53 [Nephila pilipes]|uniref:Cellular tumor antigen p53 n=1 Tax=Nephila pilipes TaxID=299642 RepID=A0A8X6PKK6_NEPPI|nr:cellular tumor antigen p53 [Nephila pilipes]
MEFHLSVSVIAFVAESGESVGKILKSFSNLCDKENRWENRVFLLRKKEDMIVTIVLFLIMDDKRVLETISSHESLPLSQDTFEYFWNEYLGSNEFHSLVAIPSPVNVVNSLFESAEIKENHSNTEIIPVEPINNAVIVSPIQNSISSSSATYIPSSLPASQNWTGQHDFCVSFGPQKKPTKGVSWTYSNIKDKLYVGKDAPCPINFSAKSIVFDNVVIRAMALYSSPEHASEVVHRCVNHSMSELSKGVFEAEHLVRCESGMAYYEIDQTTKRHSVVVPFEIPPIGQQYSTYIYKFTCFGSCAGGPNRRPLMLIFSLEKEGKVIGRQKLDVKICACPGRDKKTEEQQLGTQGTSKVSVKQKEKELISLSDTLDFTKSIYLPPLKKVKSNAGSSFTLSVTDRECYDFLKQMKKFFEICRTVNKVPPNVKTLVQVNHQKNENQEHDS